ncbi:MAG: tetratricopeptide (TPR) repeat protein [Planctomycetota bacterium]|jgi:tetratricopeptide (TPR) repeat protein
MLTCLVLASFASAAIVQENVTAPQLVAQGRALLPSYNGDHRSFLTDLQQREVRAASHLLSAALALDPKSTYAMWWKGHAETLLGEDRGNRGAWGQSVAYYESALGLFDSVLELEPDYHWAWYARGMARNRLGQPFQALADYEQSVRVANGRIAAAEDPQSSEADALFVRFKARQWQADTRIGVLAFDQARQEFREFYADNGGNPWDLNFALGESYLRQRDLGGAATLYGELLGVRDFVSFDRIHSELGYLAGLRGAPVEAHAHLHAAIQRERVATLYPRLWLWILATPERRSEAADDLGAFLEHPPASLSAWDLTVGRFLLGTGSSADFLRAGSMEEQRRMEVAVPLDDLMCEVWFYAGLKYERAGDSAKATRAYALALGYDPPKFKWEWAFARAGFARLMGQRSELEEYPAIEWNGELLVLYVHRAGELASRTELPRPLLAGDLVQAVVRAADGSRRVLRHVIGVAKD